jgi:hypothetical protein
MQMKVSESKEKSWRWRWLGLITVEPSLFFYYLAIYFQVPMLLMFKYCLFITDTLGLLGRVFDSVFSVVYHVYKLEECLTSVAF